MRDSCRTKHKPAIQLITSPMRARFFRFTLVPLLVFLAYSQQGKGASIPYPLTAFHLLNTNADGSAVSFDGGVSVVLTGGNNGTGLAGTADLLATATVAGLIAFDYFYSSLDFPGFDWAGYVVNHQFTQLADTNGQSGSTSFSVSAGDMFGFRVETLDNTEEPGIFTIGDFSTAAGSSAPEPGSGVLVLVAVAVAAALLDRRSCRGRQPRRPAAYLAVIAVILGLPVSRPAFAQSQQTFAGADVTGQLKLRTTVNLTQLAQATAGASGIRAFANEMDLANSLPTDKGKTIPLLRPPLAPPGTPHITIAMAAPNLPRQVRGGIAQALSIGNSTQATGFNGITHAQMRLADHGNQFSIEPPSPAIAVGNGFVLQGVNNAVQVYNNSGTALLATVLTSNQVFGLAPAIDQNTGIQGPFPTDMRVFFDTGISRWFILQRVWDSDANGINQPFSHMYLAVSQTNDPTGGYNVYEMDTTNAQNFFGCPCFSDYLQIGADQYGFYITADEYNAFSPFFVDATILAISKSSLAAGAAKPTAVQFTLPFATGYEFAIQPASTPPGASNFIASGGVEFFVSSQARFAIDSNLAVWAMINTSTLLSNNPNLTLVSINIPVQQYSFPDVANQKPGPFPLGSGFIPPQPLEFLDGSDDRVLSVCYAGGRLYVTLATAVVDSGNRLRVGGAYFILSPGLRSGMLAAPVLRQGALVVDNNHLLRPAIAVNAQGNGAIVFTLVGTNYFPSAAFVPISVASTSSTVQIAAAGFAPEDGFSGYPPDGIGIARWGDYSGVVVASDGSIWMVTEYIPDPATRTPKANWGTYVMHFVP
jgi:hypothetical protein